MAKIWNWPIRSFSHGQPQTNNLTVKTDQFPQGLNLFAHATLSQIETRLPHIPANTPIASIVIAGYAVWKDDGTISDRIQPEGLPSTQFIKNVAWVEVMLMARECDAIGNLTLIEWD
jgi:hypothetical protein